jgi:hypothetical protein
MVPVAERTVPQYAVWPCLGTIDDRDAKTAQNWMLHVRPSVVTDAVAASY